MYSLADLLGAATLQWYEGHNMLDSVAKAGAATASTSTTTTATTATTIHYSEPFRMYDSPHQITLFFTGQTFFR